MSNTCLNGLVECLKDNISDDRVQIIKSAIDPKFANHITPLKAMISNET